jgi:hypothetical protein
MMTMTTTTMKMMRLNPRKTKKNLMITSDATYDDVGGGIVRADVYLTT